VMPGVCGAELGQQLCLFGIGTGEGNSRDIVADDVAERSEDRLECRLADGLKRGQIAGRKGADRRAAFRHGGLLNHGA
ncbi:MAG: hypothetical protein AB7G54_07735, partial [Methyloceanibacter sp.]